MANPVWYSQWRHEALHLLQVRNKVLADRFSLGKWPRFDYDLDKRQLVFSESGQARVIAEIQVAGSTSPGAGHWLWAWANSHWPSECIEDSKQANSFGKEHGINELTSAYAESDDLNALAWELTATAARVCDAAGAYRCMSDEGGVFLLLRDVRWIS